MRPRGYLAQDRCFQGARVTLFFLGVRVNIHTQGASHTRSEAREVARAPFPPRAAYVSRSTRSTPEPLLSDVPFPEVIQQKSTKIKKERRRRECRSRRYERVTETNTSRARPKPRCSQNTRCVNSERRAFVWEEQFETAGRTLHGCRHT